MQLGYTTVHENGRDRLFSEEIQDYEPLIEEINHWQAIFEIALDEAAHHLTLEQFPAEDLKASLADMCELIRVVLKDKQGGI
jgi:hypothetical protein